MTVPFPRVDSITKEPPESSVRSLMLENPNPSVLHVIKNKILSNINKVGFIRFDLQ
jgi:hypothetical protein